MKKELKMLHRVMGHFHRWHITVIFNFRMGQTFVIKQQPRWEILARNIYQSHTKGFLWNSIKPGKCKNIQYIVDANAMWFHSTEKTCKIQHKGFRLTKASHLMNVCRHRQIYFNFYYLCRLHMKCEHEQWICFDKE